MSQIKLIYLDQGSDYEDVFIAKTITGNIINLTGATLSCKIVKYYGSSIYWSPTLEIISAIDGTFKITIPKSLSIKIPFGKYVYDVYTSTVSSNIRIQQGEIIIDASATFSSASINGGI